MIYTIKIYLFSKDICKNVVILHAFFTDNFLLLKLYKLEFIYFTYIL